MKRLLIRLAVTLSIFVGGILGLSLAGEWSVWPFAVGVWVGFLSEFFEEKLR